MTNGSVGNEEAPRESALPVDANAQALVTDRGMAATVRLTQSRNGGKDPSRELIDAALAAKNVVYGLDTEAIEALAASPVYDEPVAVARGLEAVPGTDGSLKFFVEREVQGRPKERSDGTVDYRELDLIRHVEEGQTLVERTPPTEGCDGMDVLGNTLPAKIGREVALPAGKNTVISEDGLLLLAEKSGHAEFLGGKVMVQDTYTVPADVSTATGNINFNGNVVVRGSVLSGFTVSATGNISVKGACEAAQIIAGGSVTIGEGMNGGSIQAEGDIKSKYLQNCRVLGGANVYTDSVVSCELNCGDSLVIAGGRGALLGGSCSATNLIECGNIGSRNTHVATWVEVGLDAKVQQRLEDAPKEYEQTAHLISSLDNIIGMMAQLEAAGRLDNERLQQLQSARYTRGMQYNNYLALKEEMEQLSEKAQSMGFGTIVAKGGIAPGVRIVIGPYQAVVNDLKPNVKVTRGEDGIEFHLAV